MNDQTQIPLWISQSFPIIRIVLFCIIFVCAIIMIVAILFQSEDAGSTESITGVKESYYAQNKGSSRDGKLKLITTIMAIVIFVCAILYFVTLIPFGGLESGASASLMGILGV